MFGLWYCLANLTYWQSGNDMYYLLVMPCIKFHLMTPIVDDTPLHVIAFHFFQMILGNNAAFR